MKEGYTVRHSLSSDVAAIQVLVDAVETAEAGEPRRHDLDVATEFRDLRTELTANTWVALAPSGAVAGFAFLFWGGSGQGKSEAFIHPDHKGLGVVEALIDAVERRAVELAAGAPASARPRLHFFCGETKARLRSALLDRGFHAVRESYLMRLDLSDEPVRTTPLPPGIEVRTFIPGRDDEAVYAADQEAFADHFLFEPATLDEWRLHSVEHSRFDPSLWIVAWDGDEVAGESLTYVDEYEAYVDSLSVRKRWRNRGLGLALLTRAFELARQRGLRKVRLGVDAQNPTGALALYVKAGMRIERREEVYVKDLRPMGRGPATVAAV